MTNDGQGSGEARSNWPSLQVIVLGSGGGPKEDNVTGFLVRSVATRWEKSSVLAVDAGTHLAAIVRILEDESPPESFPESFQELQSTHEKRNFSRKPNRTASHPASPHLSISTRRSEDEASKTRGDPVVPKQRPASLNRGAFAGLELPHETARANAAFITRELVSTYLITHPHLDHISGFVVNTASFQQTSRPKRLAGLPSTIKAIKTHIFNDLIWPNLSDEEGGVGLVSYMRLVEGGNVALGDGDGRGYIEVCEGLSVKGWSISHGHCMKTHSHKGSSGHIEPTSPSLNATHTAASPMSESIRMDASHFQTADKQCVYDSSAFFIRDQASGREVLMFGDVEPDSISLSPRTAHVWREAAPKVVSGALVGIFIECSFDDSQTDETLFGHLAPRHLMDELKVLADEVEASRQSGDLQAKRKRKRQSNGLKMNQDPDVRYRRGRNPHRAARRSRDRSGSSPASSLFDSDLTNDEIQKPAPLTSEHRGDPTDHYSISLGPPKDALMPDAGESNNGHTVVPTRGKHRSPSARPLEGLPVVIIHMKDTLSDGPDVGEVILAALRKYEEEVQLGCNFMISTTGASYWL